MKFTKMQGTGNDYVYVNCFEETVNDPAKVSRIISDRHFGIGSDGLILICPSGTCDVRMRMFNADGSEGSMCGNGARCIAKYVYDHGICRKDRISLETKAGVRELKVTAENGICKGVTVCMGVPKLTGEVPEKIEVGGIETEFIGVDIGNPHAVYYMESEEELKNADLMRSGPLYEHHKRFPGGVNSEFLFVKDRKNIFMRVWERGSGETLACGTGASAAAFASMISGRCDSEVTIHLLGGDLVISREEKENGRVFLTGPAEEVFTGEIILPEE